MSLSEKIEILVLLCTERNAEVRQHALDTLRHWNTQELDQVLSDPSTSSAVIDFVFDHMLEEEGNLHGALTRSSAPSEAHPPTPETKELDASSTELAPDYSEPTPNSQGQQAPAGAAETDPRRQTLLQRIACMTVPQKARLALMGSQEERLVLIRDPNRVVVRSVIQSPKLSDSEVEYFAAMRNVQDEALRIISKNRAFMKNPAVIRALVFNPRSPIDISLPLIKLLKDRDLKLLTMDKNVPDAVRNSAVRLYVTRTQKQGR